MPATPQEESQKRESSIALPCTTSFFFFGPRKTFVNQRITTLGSVSSLSKAIFCICNLNSSICSETVSFTRENLVSDYNCTLGYFSTM